MIKYVVCINDAAVNAEIKRCNSKVEAMQHIEALYQDKQWRIV